MFDPTVMVLSHDEMVVVRSSRVVAIQPHNWGYRTSHEVTEQELAAWYGRFWGRFRNPEARHDVRFKLMLHSEGREYRLVIPETGEPRFEYIHD